MLADVQDKQRRNERALRNIEAIVIDIQRRVRQAR